jgi:hypothetical protein
LTQSASPAVGGFAPATYDERPWQQEAGPTVFAPFPIDSEHFRRPDQQWAVNFRVRDLDAMIDQLRQAGIEVDEDEASYPNGRFAELTDPEGTPIQLWEPAKRPAASMPADPE